MVGEGSWLNDLQVKSFFSGGDVVGEIGFFFGELIGLYY